MKPVSVRHRSHSPVRTSGLGAIAALGVLLLTAPVTAGTWQAAGQPRVVSPVADGSPMPAPHILADGNPPSSPTTPAFARADGSPVPAPH
jgi:hypothetical protein